MCACRLQVDCSHRGSSGSSPMLHGWAWVGPRDDSRVVAGEQSEGFEQGELEAIEIGVWPDCE